MKRSISMKKVLSISVICLILTALFATVALADSDYGVTVNGIAVTDANKDDVLSDGGKVKYDPDTNTLTATEMLSTALEIKGNGATNIVVTSTNAPAAGTFSVTDVADVTVENTGSALVINGSADIKCSGEVEIKSAGNIAVCGNLKVNGATDVTVTTEASSPAITGTADITCTGNVEITNTKGIAVNGNADITCSGTAKIVNKGVFALYNLTFNQADGRAFSVKTGETVDSLATVADVEAGNAYGPAAHSEKVIYVEPVCSTVTFDANGGTASAESAVTEINGKLASLPDATLEGFVFDGWFTEKDGGEEITADTVFAADTTVYAHWTELPHVHNLTLVPAKDATATEPGNIAYYTCDGCDLWFADENGETEITDKNSVIIPALGEPTEPEEECGCPFFRWLKAFTESCIKWIKEMPVSVSEWFAGVFNNILTILKIN
ncbi:MAG: InlB B-repeat-containing protein [Acutalibacteraceae bacterium]